MKKTIVSLILAVACGVAQAAITNIQSEATSGVQEFLLAEPGTVSSESREGDPREAKASIRAVAEVESIELGGTLIGQARATSTAGDPTPLTKTNPAEFALEAACFSNTDAVSYLVTSSVAEARTIVLRRTEIAANGTAESLVTLSGAVVVWAVDSSLSLDSIEGSIEVNISDNNDELVFDSALNIEPQLENGIEVFGGLRAQEVSLEQLADLGVDNESLEILGQVQSFGRLLVFAIPRQQHRYRYTAIPNQPFTLTAQMKIRLRNAPGGTGIAVVLGRPFTELAEFIASGLPGVSGGNVEKAVNQAVANSTMSNVQDANADQGVNVTRACGVLGVEPMLFLLLCAQLQSRRKTA